MEERRMRVPFELLVIGGSAGSLEVIMQLLPRLHTDLGLAIIIVIHRRSNESVLIDLLREVTSWTVKEAEEKEALQPGTIYIAPADYHLLIERSKTLSLDDSEKVQYSRPSIDVTFESAADVYGPVLACLLLSGANADGTDGLQAVKNSGGMTMVQDPDDASVSYMPQYALDHVRVDKVVRMEDVAEVINQLNS